MSRRILLAITIALAAVVLLGRHSVVAAAPAPPYEFWQDCGALPPEADIDFLPIFLPAEEPGFVDLGDTVPHGGQTWGALQFSRDKDFGDTTVAQGKWLVGLSGDEWPANTVNVKQEMLATQMVSWEIDGVSHRVNPSCFLDLSSSEGSFGLYNVWARFNQPGDHELKIVFRQIRDFYFVIPFAEFGIPDPLGLDGRRVFVRGETAGDTLDGLIVHRYSVHVN